MNGDIPSPCPPKLCDSEGSAAPVDTGPILRPERSRGFSFAISDTLVLVRFCLPRENHDDVGILDVVENVSATVEFRPRPIASPSLYSPAPERPVETVWWVPRGAIAAEVARQGSYLQRCGTLGVQRDRRLRQTMIIDIIGGAGRCEC